MRICKRIEMATKNALYEVSLGELLSYKRNTDDNQGGYNIFLDDQEADWAKTKTEAQKIMREYVISSIETHAEFSSFHYTNYYQLPKKIQSQIRGMCLRAK